MWSNSKYRGNWDFSPEHELYKEGIHYELIQKKLDAVKVPLGICFKHHSLPCRQQMNHCMDCANFCSSKDNTSEYEAEIKRVKEQLELSKNLERNGWIEKNQKYLEILEEMLLRINEEGIIHKNGKLREDHNG